MTTLQLTGGKEIRVPLAYEQVNALLQRALREHALLEFARPDGTAVMINPNNVAYVRNGVDAGTLPTQGSGAGEATARVVAPA